MTSTPGTEVEDRRPSESPELEAPAALPGDNPANRSSRDSASGASVSPLLDLSGAAEYLSTSERHIRELWNRRELPAIKVGRKVRFHKDDLDRYINERRTS